MQAAFKEIDMRTFDHFPEDKLCPVCKLSRDLPCILIPIDGTQEGNIAEAKPVHVICLEDGWQINENVGVIYKAL